MERTRNTIQRQRLVFNGGIVMSEPRLEDDIAYYGNERCDECGERHDPDESHDYGDDPDRMWDEMHEL